MIFARVIDSSVIDIIIESFAWFSIPRPAEKEKIYSRQYSAPILKRKSSRFGLGQLLGSTPPNNSIPGRVVLFALA